MFVLVYVQFEKFQVVIECLDIDVFFEYEGEQFRCVFEIWWQMI